MGTVRYTNRCCLDCWPVVGAKIDEMGQKSERALSGLFGGDLILKSGLNAKSATKQWWGGCLEWSNDVQDTRSRFSADADIM